MTPPVTAMSIREGRRARTFQCRDDLYGAFQARAKELECSVDWLLGEAMKRLLADETLAPQVQPAIAPPKPKLRASLPPLKLGPPPLPPPPPPRRPTVLVPDKAP